jgi:glycosyltransferase involved in cell wall biosynthesis
LKVHFVLTGYLPELFGGAEVYTQNLAKALQARGHEVGVITLDLKHKRGYATDEPFEGVPVHRLGFLFEFRPPALYALQFYAEMYDEATAYFQRTRPDVVHVANSWFVPAIAFAALHLGIPVVGTHVDYLWTCRDSHLLKKDHEACGVSPDVDCRGCNTDLTDTQWPLAHRFRREQFALLAQGYAFHHCPCPLLGEHIRSLGADPRKVEVWPYGIPPRARVSKTTSDVLRLGFIGRWNRMKGIHVLLEAMEMIGADARVRLTLYGEQEVWNNDTYGAEQAERAKRLANVHIAGRFNQQELAEVHREIDVLVTPSIWPENSPVSMLEALALGTPCLCADGAGMTNLVEPETNGLVFRSRDARDLAEKIKQLAAAPELVRKLQAGAKLLRTIEEDAEKFERVYAVANPANDPAWRSASTRFVDTVRLAAEVLAPSALSTKWREKTGQLLAAGVRRIALFGAGRHTLRLLDAVTVPQGLELVAIFDENPDACGGKILGAPVRPLSEAASIKPDAVIVSSDAWEKQMLAKAAFLREHGIVVTGLYGE